MAKNKKNIKQFQDALLSNTSFIQKQNTGNMEDVFEDPSIHEENRKRKDIIIKEEHLKDIDLLAKYLEKDPNELINLAVRHFLGLKLLRLEEAKEKFKED